MAQEHDQVGGQLDDSNVSTKKTGRMVENGFSRSDMHRNYRNYQATLYYDH